MKSQKMVADPKSFDVTILILGLTVWTFIYILFNHQILVQMLLVLILGTGYVAWGVWHHRAQKIGLRILIGEYVSMGLLIVSLFAGSLLVFRI